MELTFHGAACMRLRGRETQVVVDPSDGILRQLGRTPPELVVRTEGGTDTERLRPRSGRPQEISGPGEFEVRGVRIRGLASGPATAIMQIELDEVRVVALGRLERGLSEDEIDSLGEVDALVLPIGGGEALAASAAAKLVNAIAPAVVLPVGHARGYLPGDPTASLDRFAKEMGLAAGWLLQPRLSLSPSSATGEDTRVVILEARSL